jgi:hypothetical protein
MTGCATKGLFSSGPEYRCAHAGYSLLTKARAKPRDSEFRGVRFISGPNLSIVSPWFGQTQMKSGAGHMRNAGRLMPATLDKVRSANASHAEAETDR